MTKLKSEGKCVYCEKIVAKSAISKHLDKHLHEITEKSASKNCLAFHTHVQAGGMFLDLLIDGKETLETLDQFLRSIWLECCGHMSAFTINRNEIGMQRSIADVFQEGLVMEYEYDFGSTTGLDIKVNSEFPMTVQEGIKLLSRNNPLTIMCSVCKKRLAEKICIIHVEEDEGFFCNECAQQHGEECEDFADYGEMPVVNSPRMGVCGYMGGMIDKERDSISYLPMKYTS